MYIPTFELTHRLVDYLIRLELSVKSIKDIPLPSSEKSKLIQNSEAESLFNISKLADSAITLNKAKIISSHGKDILSEDKIYTLLSNFRGSWDFSYSSINEKNISLTPSLLLHMNKLLMDNVVESWEVGRFRTIKDSINDKFDSFSNYRNKEYDDYDFENVYYEIFNWSSSNQHKIHPIIKIAVILFEILQSYPFISGNIFTAIAISDYMYEKSYLSLNRLFSFSKTFINYREELSEALTTSINQKENQTRWIEELVRGVALDITEIKNEIIQFEEEKIGSKKKKFLGLNTRQLRLMKWLQKKEKIYRREYVKRMGVSTMTAYRDLNELLKRKLIIQKGGGRSTYYTVYKYTEPIGEKPLPKTKIIKVINDLE